MTRVSTWVCAAFVAAVATVAGGCARTTPEDETRELARALGGFRATEARLSGFDEWHAWAPASTLSEAQKGAVYASAAAIQKHVPGSRNGGWYAALGVRHLLLGELPRAIGLLESSRTLQGDHARRLNDLAAAYFARGTAEKNPEQLANALDLAEAAVRVNPALLAAQFNRALILESLGPASRAADAWRDYQLADPSSGWSIEAGQRRDRLMAVAPPPSADSEHTPAPTRQTVERHLLQWAHAFAGDRPAAADIELRAAEAVATGLAQTGNTYPAALVADLRRHERMGRAKQFALAYATGDEGMQLMNQAQSMLRGRVRVGLAAALVAPGGALADLLGYWRLHAEWYDGKLADLEPQLLDLIARSDTHGSNYVAARARVLLGSVQQKLARFSDAIESYRRGMDLYLQTGEADRAATTRMLLAAALREHGMWHEAWEQESLALASYDNLTDDAQRHSILHEATRLALARRQTDLAARFQQFLALHAGQWKKPGAVLAASMSAARIHLQRGERQDAALELERAQAAFAQIEDAGLKKSYGLELLTVTTEVQTQVAPAKAVESARALLTLAEEEGALYRRVRSNYLFGRAALLSGQKTEATQAWLRGISVLERDNGSAREEQLRIARTSDVWAIYDDLIRLLVDERRTDDALQVAERGRARALLYSIDGSAEFQPPSIQNGPSGATVIYYTLLRDRTLIWLIDEGKITDFSDRPGGTLLVTALTDELRAAAASRADAAPVLQRLYGALVAPVAGKLTRERPIVIVPDGAMSSVPFAALRSPEKRRLLVEDHELQIVPSLALMQRTLQSVATRPAGSRILALGSPAASPGLPALPGARREVDAIAGLYANDRVPLGDTVSVPAFLQAVRTSNIVHFAGHAVEDREYPDRSFLALPGEERLRPAQIQRADFGGVRLLVLSACSTAGGAVERGEGALSLARPFLAAGVGQVLATVNAVEDDVAPLLVEFHRNLRAGMAAPAALRAMQLKAYRETNTVALRGWAAFELVGVVKPAPAASAAERR